MKATIGIVERNAARDIGESLKALLRQSEKDFEVVLVDSDSDDKTLDIVAGYMPRFRNFRVIRERCTVGAGRQLVVEAARSDIILWLDGDEVPSDNWVEEMLACFERNPSAEKVEGVWRVYPDKGFLYNCIGAVYANAPRPKESFRDGELGSEEKTV